MSLDPRQNTPVPLLSEKDAASPKSVSEWASAVANKLNQLKTPRFAVRVSPYKFNQDANGAGPTIKLDNIGFVPGAIILGAVNVLGDGTTALDLGPADAFVLAGVQVVGNSAQFYLRQTSGVAVSAYNGASLQLVLVVFEKDSINPLTANSQFHPLMRTLSGKR